MRAGPVLLSQNETCSLDSFQNVFTLECCRYCKVTSTPNIFATDIKIVRSFSVLPLSA